MYGLVGVYPTTGYPVRPIVSAVKTFNCNLCTFLAHIYIYIYIYSSNIIHFKCCYLSKYNTKVVIVDIITHFAVLSGDIS